MARAKRTDRTEARRRHRAEQAELAPDTTSEETVDRSAAKTPAPVSGQPAKRPGIMSSFKAAYRPVQLVADLKAAPQVLTHWGFLAAVGVTIAGTAVFIQYYGNAVAGVAEGDTAGLTAVIQANTLPYLLATMLISPPPAAGAFVIGFTAKRASWLAGLVYGIVATAAFAVVLSTPAGRLLTGDQPTITLMAGAAAWSPVGAALFAAAAAWYKRFLDLSNPNRNRAKDQAGKPQTGKPQSGRGNVKPNSRSSSAR